MEAMMTLELTAELYRNFAQDDTDKANVSAVDTLRKFFRAEEAALFYVNGKKEHHMCLAGVEYPILLSEAQWRRNAIPSAEASPSGRLGPWVPPTVGVSLHYWIHSVLYASEENRGRIFLGRNSEDWDDEEIVALESIARAIEPIVRVRFQREREENQRRSTELMLRDNERRLRAFFDESHDMIYMADSGDIVTNVNGAGLKMLGLSDSSDIVGKAFSACLVNPEDRETLLRRLHDSGTVSDYEILLKRKDGQAFFGTESVQAVRDRDGTIIEVISVVKDISERVRNEQALWKSNMELVESNLELKRAQELMIQQEKLASIGLLSAGIAHEINNPLGFLKSNHGILLKHAQRLREIWDEVRKGARALHAELEGKYGVLEIFEDIDSIGAESAEGYQRIIRIIANLKNFSRKDQEAGFEEYDLNAGIESTLVVAWNELKYVVDVKKDLGQLPMIQAIGGEINQVILNILVNAAQAIEAQKRPTKGRIEISTFAKGNRVICRIKDDGPGIPEHIRRRVFDPFFTTKEPGKGTGLGLSISYGIVVTKHGGKLSVESDAGIGTSFVIELPVERVLDDSLEIEEPGNIAFPHGGN